MTHVETFHSSTCSGGDETICTGGELGLFEKEEEEEEEMSVHLILVMNE
jgi:hypothetical protein